MFDITSCLHSFNSTLHGNKWDCSCASGLHEALSDLTNVKLIHKAYCETPDLARNQPIDNFKCAGEYRRQKNIEANSSQTYDRFEVGICRELSTGRV